MTGYLTTHVLDTARGCPAAGLQIALYRLGDGAPQLVGQSTTNADGRTDSPILPAAHFETGRYELLFHCGGYFRSWADQTPDFLDEIPIRFGMFEAAHYHVPLLLSPYGYSTYRGS